MRRALCLLDVRALPMALLSPPLYDRAVSAVMRVAYLGWVRGMESGPREV